MTVTAAVITVQGNLGFPGRCLNGDPIGNETFRRERRTYAELAGVIAHARHWHWARPKTCELFDGIDHIFQASLTELEAAGLPAAAAQSIALGRSRELAEKEVTKVVGLGGAVVSQEDPRYPKRLLEIYDPPLVLYVRGSLESIDKYGVAVVGTRHPTPYGTGMAERLAADLAARGLVVISGMARGIDSAAHRGALSSRGLTVAVWGTGVDVPYPKENAKLAERMLEAGGAILSEFPMGTFPAPQNFPIRNRIISGMSVGVLVLEAGNTAERGSRRGVRWNKAEMFMRFRGM